MPQLRYWRKPSSSSTAGFIRIGGLFLMGTFHRFPGQWLFVSVLYLHRLPETLVRQQPLC
jgi:hypothetical protein